MLKPYRIIAVFPPHPSRPLNTGGIRGDTIGHRWQRAGRPVKSREVEACGKFRPPSYCPVIVRIRERTHHGGMGLLSRERPSQFERSGQRASGPVADEPRGQTTSLLLKEGRAVTQGSRMPKVELNATVYDRLNAIATNTMTVEMLVNRAVDDYLKTRAEGSPKNPPRIHPKPR